MRIALVLILAILLVPLRAMGQSAAERDQILAATSSAVSSLYDQIAAQPLGRTLTVGDLLARTKGGDQMRQLLQGSEQIGGPRWIGSTCQVALEVPATRVASLLKQIATEHPDATPIAAAEIDRAARPWVEQVFSATGSATSSSAVIHFRPPDDEAWQRVNVQARERTLAAARDDAVRRMVDGVRPVLLTQGHTIGDALDAAQAKPAANLSQWLISRPVSRVNFRPNLEVEVWLSVPADGFYDEMRAAVQMQRTVPVPLDDASWRPCHDDFLSKLPRPVGRATVAPEWLGAASQPAVRLPRTAPQWIDAPWEVEGNSPPSGSKLKCARQAEADARKQLRGKLAALPITPEMSLDAAADRDKRFSDALDKIVAKAHISRAEYHPDGSATIVLYLDLRDAWDELRQSAGD